MKKNNIFCNNYLSFKIIKHKYMVLLLDNPQRYFYVIELKDLCVHRDIEVLNNLNINYV